MKISNTYNTYTRLGFHFVLLVLILNDLTIIDFIVRIYLLNLYFSFKASYKYRYVVPM